MSSLKLRDKTNEARILRLLGNQYLNRKRYLDGLEFYEKAITLYQRIEDFENEASLLELLGNIFFKANQHETGLKYYQRSVSLFENIGDKRGEARSLELLGKAYFGIEKVEEGILYYQSAIVIYQQLDDKVNEARILQNIGTKYFSIGKENEALNYHQLAINIYQQMGDQLSIEKTLQSISLQQDQQEFRDDFSQALSNIDLQALSNIEQNEDELEFLQQQADFYKQKDNKINEARMLEELGSLLIKKEQYLKAYNVYQRLVFIVQEITNNDYFSMRSNLILYGKEFQEKGQYEYALKFRQLALQQSYQLQREPKHLFSNLVGEDFAYIASIYLQQQQIHLAIIFYKKAINSYESTRAKFSENQVIAQTDFDNLLLGEYEKDYRKLVDLLLSQGRIPEAQQVLELLKVQEISDYTRSGIGVIDGEQTIATNTTETEILAIHDSKIALGKNILDCELDETFCDDATYYAYLDQRDEVTEAFEMKVKQLEGFISQRNVTDAVFLNPNNISAKSEQLLETQPNSLLIYPIVLEDKLWILWAAEGSITSSVEINDIGEADLSRKVLELRQLLQSPSSDLDDIKARSQELHNYLIPPELQAEIKANSIENLIFSLDHVTRYLPMEVLYDGTQYLFEKYNTATIISTELGISDEKLPAAPSILATGTSKAVGGFNALPNVIDELNAIVLEGTDDDLGIFPGQTFLNETFDEKTISRNLRGHNILHIATHGEFVPGDNNKSYLLLGNGDKYPIPEIKNLRGLNKIHIAILSACETALGGAGTNGTEIAGISSYFLSKGVDTVIASLWKVDDQSTSLLMELFYQNLSNGDSKREALRKSRLSLMQSDEQLTTNLSRGFGNSSRNQQNASQTTNFEHPYHWASFILIGNGL